MPTSRFLKKKRSVAIEEDPVISSLTSSSPSGNALKTKPEERGTTGNGRWKSNTDQQLWKLKDEDFVSRINKRLDNLTKTLSPTLSSSLISASATSPKPRSKPAHSSHYPSTDDDATMSYDQIARDKTPHVPTINQERPRVIPDRWEPVSNRSSDRLVRSFLLDRKCSRDPHPEDDQSDLIQSLWQIVQATGSGVGHTAEFYRLPESSTRQELAEFSSNIGPILPPPDSDYLLDGRDFWSRLATCKGEFLRTEQLVGRTFYRNQSFEDHSSFSSPPHHVATLSSRPSTEEVQQSGFLRSQADEAVHWALHNRLKILDY